MHRVAGTTQNNIKLEEKKCSHGLCTVTQCDSLQILP